MPRERNESNPDVNSPIGDSEYDSDDNLPGKDKPTDIREPEEDDGGVKRPDIDDPFPDPEDGGPLYPVEDPPLEDV